MSMAAVAVVGAAAISYQGQKTAAGAASSVNAANIEYQNQYNEQVDPFSTGGNRAQYVPQLNALMQGGPQSLQNDPSLKWLQNQGQEAVQRQFSAKGQQSSGNEMLALMKQNYGTTMDYFNQQYARLADLSGASRGGSKTVEGMSPTTAGGIAMAPYQAAAEGLGGIASLYKNTPSTNTTTQQLPNPGQAPSGYNWGTMEQAY